MSDSTHKVEVVRVHIESHPNADRLDVADYGPPVRAKR